MSEIHYIKNARNLKSTFDLRWANVLYAIKYKWWKNKYKIGKAILNVDA